MVDEMPSGPGPDSESTDPGASTEPKSKVWIWVVVGVVALALLGGWYYMSQSEDGNGWLLLFGTPKVATPEVVGLTQETAETAITAAGLTVGEVSEEPTLGAEPGTVTAQDPEAGLEVEEGSSVDLVVATVPVAGVPDVVGDSQEEAAAKLAQEGLRIGDVEYAYNKEVDAGFVISQDPEAGSEVVVGSAVQLSVSKGEETGQVPNVVGLSQDDAIATLEAAGFEVKTTKEKSESVEAGDVIAQSPAAGKSAAAGSTVTITVSSGAPEAPQSVVPDVVGAGPLQAIADILAAGLKVKLAWVADDDNIFKVSAQKPPAGTEVDPGTTVSIDIGLPAFIFDFEMPSELPTATPAPLPAPVEPESGEPSETTGG